MNNTSIHQARADIRGAGFYLWSGLDSVPLSASDLWGNSMHKTDYKTDYLPRLQPWSPAAFAAAFAAVVFAATMQEIILSFGTLLYFAGFIPAILVASLLGGAPAGTFAAVLSIPIVWWAFMPPHFEFNPLTSDDSDSFATFVLVSSLLICFSHLYREARVLMRK